MCCSVGLIITFDEKLYYNWAIQESVTLISLIGPEIYIFTSRHSLDVTFMLIEVASDQEEGVKWCASSRVIDIGGGLLNPVLNFLDSEAL